MVIVNLIKISDVTIDGLVNNKQQLVEQLPELYALRSAPNENNEWHNEHNIFSHTLEVAKNLQKSMRGMTNSVDKYLRNKTGSYAVGDLLFLSALFHDIGKNDTMVINSSRSWRNAPYSSCPGHEKAGAEKTRSILQRFDLDEAERERVVGIIRNHAKPHALLDSKDDISLEDKEAMLIFREYPDFKQEFTEVHIDLLLLGKADMLGSHLAVNNRREFERRMSLYDRLLDV